MLILRTHFNQQVDIISVSPAVTPYYVFKWAFWLFLKMHLWTRDDVSTWAVVTTGSLGWEWVGQLARCFPDWKGRMCTRTVSEMLIKYTLKVSWFTPSKCIHVHYQRESSYILKENPRKYFSRCNGKLIPMIVPSSLVYPQSVSMCTLKLYPCNLQSVSTDIFKVCPCTPSNYIQGIHVYPQQKST